MNRAIAWFAFVLGIVASTAANVAHARPELGPRLVAAFAPLALMLTVEIAVRAWARSGWRWSLARWGGTGLVAVVTAVVSYRHQAGLFAQWGEDPLNAHILPLSSDGLMLVAAAALLSMSLSKSSPVQSIAVDSPVQSKSGGWTVQPVPVQRSGQSSLKVQKDSPVQSSGTVQSARLDRLRLDYPDGLPTTVQIKSCLDIKSQQTASDLRKLLAAERGV